jgi:hypothetical protein
MASDNTQSLDAIGLKFHTDKSSEGHDYLTKYEPILSPFRDQAFNIIEIGCLHGASLNMWGTYFPNAKIIAIDIYNKLKNITINNLEFILADASDPSILHEICKKFPPLIVIDDASHRWSHQQIAFETAFWHLLPGGVYICEDIQTSFGPHRSTNYGDQSLDAAQYFGKYALLKACGSSIPPIHPLLFEVPQIMLDIAQDINVISFISEAVIMQKATNPKNINHDKHIESLIKNNHMVIQDFYATILRDAALALEESDLSLSQKLMYLALVARPTGSLIKAKYEEYCKKLTTLQS